MTDTLYGTKLMSSEKTSFSPEQALGNAVVKSAAADYLQGKTTLLQGYTLTGVEKKYFDEAVLFFNTPSHFEIFSKLDPVLLMKKLDKYAAELVKLNQLKKSAA